MEKKIGFIGCGNMGTAMIQGILESGKCPPQEMMISCRTKKTLEEKKAQFGVQISTDNRDVAAFADILFVAVKPQFYAEVLEEIKDLLTEEQILVSIAPGKTLVWFDEVLGRNLKSDSYDAEYPIYGQRRHDGYVCGSTCDGCGYGSGAGSLQWIFTDGSHSGASDGCGYCRQRKLSGLCIYVY